jgi:hypothetical protein
LARVVLRGRALQCTLISLKTPQPYPTFPDLKDPSEAKCGCDFLEFYFGKDTDTGLDLRFGEPDTQIYR